MLWMWSKQNTEYRMARAATRGVKQTNVLILHFVLMYEMCACVFVCFLRFCVAQ